MRIRRRPAPLDIKQRQQRDPYVQMNGSTDVMALRKDRKIPSLSRKASFCRQTSFICSLALLLVFVSLVQLTTATEIVIEVDGSSSVSEERGSTEPAMQEEGSTEPAIPNELKPAGQDESSQQPKAAVSQDDVEDSLYDPLQADPDCDDNATDCWAPPQSTVEETSERVTIDAITCSYGGDDPDKDFNTTICGEKTEEYVVDRHWGSDPAILRMRDKLRQSGSGLSKQHGQQHNNNHRPPIFLMPGLASTRLVAWRFKSCPHHPLLTDIKIQDNVWLNVALVVQMGTIDVSCMKECLQLGVNQTDTDDLETGCKLRPDEGLDAISSLSPGGIGSQLLVGGTNTVYGKELLLHRSSHLLLNERMFANHEMLP